jgi:hypothetical protein
LNPPGSGAGGESSVAANDLPPAGVQPFSIQPSIEHLRIAHQGNEVSSMSKFARLARIAGVTTLGVAFSIAGGLRADDDTPTTEPSNEAQVEEVDDIVNVPFAVAGGVQFAQQAVVVQIKEKAEVVKDKPAADKPASDKDKSDKPDGDDNGGAAPAPVALPSDPDVVTMTLADGSKITGKLTIQEIKVNTSFGVLTVPISKIQSFTPGLESRSELASRVNGFIDKMGDAQYSNREQAEKALLAMGPGVREEIRRHLDDKNAERVKNLKSLLEKLNELGSDDEEGKSTKTLSRHDMVVTPSFTAAGHISPDSFEVVSKFGKLTVKLADIQSLERPMQHETEIYKTVKVDGNQHIIQKGVLNTKVQVERGDRITIKADGNISMTPWGSEYTSGPDGDGNQYGWYVQNDIPSGALIGRIGSTDKPFKIGSSSSITAKKSGTLYLAIAMHPGQASSPFPGTYNVKIRVEHK